jgi:hypothetical protein
MRIAASILSLLLLPVLVPTILAQSAEQQPQKMADQACSDSSNDCKPTVCWAGDKGDCSCFTCEYGKETSHVICTKKKDDKKVLFDYVEKSIQKKEKCPSLSMAPEKPALK